GAARGGRRDGGRRRRQGQWLTRDRSAAHGRGRWGPRHERRVRRDRRRVVHSDPDEPCSERVGIPREREAQAERVVVHVAGRVGGEAARDEDARIGGGRGGGGGEGPRGPPAAEVRGGGPRRLR